MYNIFIGDTEETKVIQPIKLNVDVRNHVPNEIMVGIKQGFDPKKTVNSVIAKINKDGFATIFKKEDDKFRSIFGESMPHGGPYKPSPIAGFGAQGATPDVFMIVLQNYSLSLSDLINEVKTYPGVKYATYHYITESPEMFIPVMPEKVYKTPVSPVQPVMQPKVSAKTIAVYGGIVLGTVLMTLLMVKIMR